MKIRGLLPVEVKIGAGIFLWLVLISWLHFTLNTDNDKRRVVVIGYMPVITNLACPILDEATRKRGRYRIEAVKFSSFADMGEALRSGAIDAAFMIAPLAIVLRQQGEDLKVVYIGNRHESTLVVREGAGIRNFKDLAGKKLAVPMRYSGHNISALQLAEKNGIRNSIEIVEMNPPDMAVAMITGSLDAYFVGEPFAAQGVYGGHAKVLHYVEDIWPDFVCNLMLIKNDLIKEDPLLAKSLVEWSARAGLWAREHPEKAAKIASKYWGQPLELVEYALSKPFSRVVYDKFTPKENEMEYLANEMVRFGLIKHADISGLVFDEFAKNANLDGIEDLESVITETN